MLAQIQIDAIESMPKKRLVGYCAILNHEAATEYYEKLWVNFIERINQIPALSKRDLYGVCTNLQGNNYFEYWTTVECHAQDRIPPDLVQLPLDGGIYGSRIERPEVSLPMFYTKEASSWTPPKDYVLDWKLPFFEVYKPNWFNRKTVKICIPLNFSLNALLQHLFPRG
ncbi:MAG: GyrI-like domain-containing protein [Deltaproteobacteria bacterium]|jgi:predicted transcriptional regulator YdeE|nr:GyrI-like domain-containing protein [Deltaproteobacteria bacterium]